MTGNPSWNAGIMVIVYRKYHASKQVTTTNKMGVVKYICVNAFGTTTAATPFLKKKKKPEKSTIQITEEWEMILVFLPKSPV